jgi:hypothetical protein
MEIQLHLFLTSAPNRDVWSASRSSLLIPGARDLSQWLSTHKQLPGWIPGTRLVSTEKSNTASLTLPAIENRFPSQQVLSIFATVFKF